MSAKALAREAEINIYYKYGLRKNEYQVLWLRAGGKCEICRTSLKSKLVPGSKGASASVDHCHESGEARGLLCNECNLGLGRFKDNAESLATAIDYLKRGTTGVSNPEKVGLPQIEKQEQEEADRLAGIERDSNGNLRGGKSGIKRNRRTKAEVETARKEEAKAKRKEERERAKLLARVAAQRA